MKSDQTKFVVVLLDVTPRVLDGVVLAEGIQLRGKQKGTHGYTDWRRIPMDVAPVEKSLDPIDQRYPHGFVVRRVKRSRQSTRVCQIGMYGKQDEPFHMETDDEK